VDGLSARVAVIGGSGEIVFVNEAWRSFARANGGDPARVCEGADYLGACDSATGTYSEGATEFAAGLRGVLAGRRDSFELEYPCPGPDGPRWFVARATRLPASMPPRAVVAHEDVTDRRRYERERLRSRTSKAAARARAHEQRRVGRELHDRVAHLMGVVHQSLELHEALKGRDPGKAAEKMALARRATKEAMAATRDLSQALRHAEAGEGLEAALSGLLRETVPPGVAHELSVSGDEEAIPEEAREQLFLVLREAVRKRRQPLGGGEGGRVGRRRGGQGLRCRRGRRAGLRPGSGRRRGERGPSLHGRARLAAGGYLFGGLDARRGYARGRGLPGSRRRELTSENPLPPKFAELPFHALR
jgi:hypothetical protein